MTTIPLSIAIVCSEWGTERDEASALEADLLRSALTVPSRHRFLVYPDTKVIRAIVEEAGATSRVGFVRSVRKTRIHRRVWRRAKRLIRRRKRPPFSALLNEALVAAGADCVWFPGQSLTALALPYVGVVRHLQHRTHPWLPVAGDDSEWRERDRELEEFALRASALVVGTSALALQLRDAYGNPPGGTHIVPLPTPSYAMDASQRPRQPRPANIMSRYLFYAAPLAPVENHLTAVRVLASMTGMAAQPSLVLAGTDRGTQAHIMREAEALGVASRVVCLGAVAPERLVALYQNAEAMIYPSLAGSGATAPLEAMALGCPVIAANVPGADEVIGDAGILVDPMDPEGYVAAIRSLRHDPLRRESLVERGVLRARGWSAPQYCAAVLALIDAQVAPARALWP